MLTLTSRAAARLARQPLRAMSSEVDLLQELLAAAKTRKVEAEKQAEAEAIIESGAPRFQVQTFNAISPVGLSRFPQGQFELTGSSGEEPTEAHAVLLRSHKLQSDEVAPSVRAIARCGAGTNNIPIPEMTARGIPVFNTPGANANAVKELMVTSIFLAARGIVEGIEHTKQVICVEESDHKSINARIEKDKKLFAGGDIAGKTLAVLGLGNIGAMCAEAALGLGMNVVGYDPHMSVDAAWRMSSRVRKFDSMKDCIAAADFVSVNVPYIKDATHHLLSDELLGAMKPTAHLLNFARGEIVDGAAMLKLYEKGHTGKYISDFPDEHLQMHEKFICIPHLGASTEEAEDNCAIMAADQVMDFIETGTIKNSVNMPPAHLPRQSEGHARVCIITENKPGVLGALTTLIGGLGFNIAQQLNTSKDSIAYNVIDLEAFERDAVEKAQEELVSVDGVLSTRVIWTGHASEGPGSFYVQG